jgi:hypothetical protein
MTGKMQHPKTVSFLVEHEDPLYGVWGAPTLLDIILILFTTIRGQIRYFLYFSKFNHVLPVSGFLLSPGRIFFPISPAFCNTVFFTAEYNKYPISFDLKWPYFLRRGRCYLQLGVIMAGCPLWTKEPKWRFQGLKIHENQ